MSCIYIPKDAGAVLALPLDAGQRSNLQAGCSPLPLRAIQPLGTLGVLVPVNGRTLGQIPLLGSAHCRQLSAHVGLAGVAEGRRQSHL